MDLPKYINFHAEAQFLQIHDSDGVIEKLPDNFFDAYRELKTCELYIKNLEALPPSFDKLANLENFTISGTKFRQLPDALFSLKLHSLKIRDNNLLDIDSEAKRLALMPELKRLSIGGYRGNKFPAQLNLLTGLEFLALTNDKKNQATIADIVQLVDQLPKLKEVELHFAYKAQVYDELLTVENVLVLDKLEKLEGGGWLPDIKKWPLAMGLTKKVRTIKNNDPLVLFREKLAGRDCTSYQRQLLFGMYIGNFTALGKWLPDLLASAIANKENVVLCLLEKPKGENLSSINKKLGKYGIKAGNTVQDENSMVVIGATTGFDEVVDHVMKGCPFITVDQLQKVLIGEGDHWMLQEENANINEQLLRLLASHQADNYKLAFQMIETGGANKVIQSVLAAIMMAHPGKEIHKPAEKLYDKFGSPSFKAHIKSSKISLRTGGDIERKLVGVLTHPDIEPFIFRLMYHRIAGANDNIKVNEKIFEWNEKAGLELPEEMTYFTQIEALRLEGCKDLNIRSVIRVLKKMPGCKSLYLNGCHVDIPSVIGELVQLQQLEIAFNTLEDAAILQDLRSLKVLNVEGVKIKNWSWLPALIQLTHLNVNNNQLAELPPEIFSLPQLQQLEAMQNKIKAAPGELISMIQLQHLDLSNNQVEEFPYFLAGLTALKELLLRSNKIKEVNTDNLYAATKNKRIEWEKLNLSRNQLTSLKFRKDGIALRELDISHNQLEEFDDSLFPLSLRAFYGNDNKISAIPRALGNTPNFTYLWLQNNLIRELPDYFAHASIQNCDLRNNRIASIHPDFEKYGNAKYARLYWKLEGNPLPKVNIGGMYIH